MATNIWGVNEQGLIDLAPTQSLTPLPAVADHGGGEIAIAAVVNGQIQVQYYDEQGLPTAARPTAIVSDAGLTPNFGEIAITASGVLGYGVAWTEGSAVKARYIGLTAAYDLVLDVGTGHHVSVSGYTLNDTTGNRPIVDGFVVTWIGSDGNVHMQKYGVWLDSAKDPIGQVSATGWDGIPTVDTPPAGNEATRPTSNDGNAELTLSTLAAATDLSMTTTINGETVVAWVEDFTTTNENVHVQVRNADGTFNSQFLNMDRVGTNDLSAISNVKTVGLANGDVVVAYSTATGIYANVLTAGTFANSGGRVLIGGAGITALTGFNGEFAIASMLDSTGFTLTYTDTRGLEAISFDGARNPLDIDLDGFAAPVLLSANAAAIAATSMAGDRSFIIAQNGTTLSAVMVDPRTAVDAFGNPVSIALNGPGLSLQGTDTALRVRNDTVVGTIGNDIIDGGAGADILDGGLGNDTILAGVGSDVIDGGGNTATGDTLVLTGTRADYTIQFLGGSLFNVTDNRTNGTGSDIVRNVEFFQFNTATGTERVNALAVFGDNGPGATPTAWGLTNTDADLLPDLTRSPDTDGWIVNNDGDRAGQQANPFVSDSVGEFVAVVWESHQAGVGTAPPTSRIRGSFLDVLGQPDAITPLPNNIDLTDGLGYEFNAKIASGGANSGWGLVFSESGGTGEPAALKTSFVFLNPGQEIYVDDPTLKPNAATLDQHDAAIFGSFLDRVVNPNGGTTVTLPTGMNDGYNIVYVETDRAAPTDPADPAYGTVKIQRFEVPLDAVGTPQSPIAAGLDGLANISLGDEANGTTDAPFVLSASGRNPSITGLHTFETVAVWIEKDINGAEHVVGAALDDMGNFIAVPSFANISGGDKIAACSVATVVSAGAVNAAVVWVAETAPGIFELRAKMYSSPGTGQDGTGFALPESDAFSPLVDALPITAAELPSLRVTGLSGEDSNDLVIQWTHAGDTFATHVKVTLDPVTGVALAMQQEGDIVTVNAVADGTQDQGSVAGLLGDRFISVFVDNGSATGADGGDVVARIFDTRQPGQLIVGDLVTPAGTVQARRDILVGTIGNDTIRGDIDPTNGLVDAIYGGMGDDVLIGGGGLKGAAGSPELIDGGLGRDTSVYSGNFSDYTITPIFDSGLGAGFEIVDNRPLADAAGNPLPHDGVDNVYNIEVLQFADKTIDLTQVYLPAKPEPLASFNGTPTAWSLTDESQYKPVVVANGATHQAKIAVSNLQDDAAMVWTASTGTTATSPTTQVFGVRYDITGQPDPLWALAGQAAGPIQMNTTVDSIVDKPVVAMAGGLGFVGAWLSTAPGGSTEVHLRFGSTATDTPFDPAAGAPGYGWAGGEVTVAGSAGATAAAVQGYEIVNAANDTLEVGFHVAFVVGGNIMLGRYEIPVYDLDVNGVRTTPSTPASFGGGAETQPVLLGADGLRNYDPLTGAQVDDPNGAVQVGTGHDPSLATLHDGQLVLAYVDGTNQVHLKIFENTVNQTADRGGAVQDVTGVTTYNYTPVDQVLGSTGAGAAGAAQKAVVIAQQNGSFGVFWGQETGSGTVIMAETFKGLAPSWQVVGPVALDTGGLLPTGTKFAVASGGVNGFGLEAGFVVTWEKAGHIVGQNFDMNGAKIGDVFFVDNPTGTTHTGLVSAGIDNGLILVGYEDPTGNGDVGVSYLDTRQPGEVTIGPRVGAPADVAVGTTGDDAMDGRNRNDTLYGGLGDDVITLGAGTDTGDGGAGNDIILGGSGQDQLLGGDGTDLLIGWASDVIIPQVDRDLQTALATTAAPADLTPAQWAAIIASDAGADLISGGAGRDTISYRQDIQQYRIDLASGVTMRVASNGVAITDNGSTQNYVMEDVIGAIVDNGAGGTQFVFTNDVEDAEGGSADDILLGNALDNVLTGGDGNDYIDGRDGARDTAVFAGAADAYTIVRTGALTTVSRPGETDTLTNVEFLQFADRRIAVPLADGTYDPVLLASANVNPVAADDAIQIAPNHTGVLKVLVNDTDADIGQTLTVTRINGSVLTPGDSITVGGLTLSLATANQIVIVAGAATGGSSFQYTISDGNGGTATANVTVNVRNPVGSPPTGRVLIDSGVTDAAGAAVLTAGNTLVDPDITGPVPITYQWMSSTALNGTYADIAGATAPTLTAAPGVITYYTLKGTYTDPFGSTTISSSDKAVVGTIGGDTIAGSGVQFIMARAGNDTITGFAGNLTVDGGAGTDTIALTATSADLNVAADSQIVGVENISAATVTTSVQISLANQLEGFAITGGSAGDVIAGGFGNDTITGNAGNDVLGGGGGNDTFVATLNDGNDAYDGGDGSDTITIAAAVTAGVTLNLVAGTMSSTQTGTDTVTRIENFTGGAGNDVITGDVNNNILNGGAGNDTFNYVIGGGADTIIGGGQVTADILNIQGAAGIVDETLAVTWGGAGLITGFNGSTLTGIETVNAALSGGVDTLAYTTTSAVTVNLATGAASGFSTTSGIENVTGGSGGDTFTGNASANSIDGGAGNDTFNATVNDGNDAYIGGIGTDTYSLASITQAVNVDLAAGIASGAQIGTDTLSGIENVTGGSGNDILTGDANNNVLAGGAGDDTFNTVIGGGIDTFTGGGQSVADTLNILGATGNVDETLTVTYAGGALITGFNGSSFTGIERINATLGGGADTLSYGTSGSAVTVNLGAGTASGFTSISGIENVTGGTGGDTFTGSSADNILNGGTGADTAIYVASILNYRIDMNAAGQLTVQRAADGADTLISIETLRFAGTNYNSVLGTTGNNGALNGGAGLDLIVGGAGNDTISAGGGADIIIGGVGNDVMTGGGANDTFVFAAGFGSDRITDFNATGNAANHDKLDISALGITAANFSTNVSLAATTVGGVNSTLITFAGVTDQIVLTGVAVNNVTAADDFLLA